MSAGLPAMGPGHFRRPESLEMRCNRPGHWTVEGFDVERRRVDGKSQWVVFTRDAVGDGGEPGVLYETFQGQSRTLTGACELIWELLVADGRAS